MNDAKLAELAAEFKRLGDEAKTLTGKRDEIKAKLLAEMERRGTEGIITHGLKITYVQQQPVVVDEVKLHKKLTREQWMAVTKRVLSKDLLSAAVQEGTVPLGKVSACSTVVPNAPYILVNPA